MKAASRDLLVLSKSASINKREMEIEVEKLNQLLFRAETIEKLCTINEVIDINNYKIVTRYNKIEKVLSAKKLKPFQFIFNKN